MKPKPKAKRKFQFKYKPGRGWTGDYGRAGLGDWVDANRDTINPHTNKAVRVRIVAESDFRRLVKAAEGK